MTRPALAIGLALFSAACAAGRAASVPGPEVAVYSISYTSGAFTELENLLRERAPDGESSTGSFETRVSGKLSRVVLGLEDGHVRVLYQVHETNVAFRSAGRELSAETLSIREALAKGVVARVTPEGLVESVRIAAEPGALAHGVIRALLGVLQFSLPPQPAAQWEVVEEDPTGAYTAHYEVLGFERETLGGDLTVRKTKREYLPRRSPGPSAALGAVEVTPRILPAGSLEARLDRAGARLLSLHGSETAAVEVGGKRIATTRTTVHLRIENVEPLSPPDLALLERLAGETAAFPTVPLRWQEPATQREAAMQRKVLGESTLDDLLAAIRRADAEGVEPPGPVGLFLELKALVYLRPATAARLACVVERAPLGSVTMSVISSALGYVGHEEAQAALAAVIRRRADDAEVVAYLLPLLGSAPLPSREAEQTLRDLAFRSPLEDVGTTARLALGAMARKLSARAPERAEEIVSALIESAGDHPGDEAVRRLLLALGNAGSPRLLPMAQRMAVAAAAAHRSAAVAAVRFVEAPGADAILFNALSDPSAGVRLEAVYALGKRAVTAERFAAQEKAFVAEEKAAVRLALLENLWFARADFPRAMALIRAAARDDPSDQVRRKAAWFSTAPGFESRRE